MRWRATFAGSASQGCVIWDGQTLIATVPGDIDAVRRIARLIAAAPEMLDLLDAARVVLKNRDQDQRETALLATIKIVIAKIEG